MQICLSTHIQYLDRWRQAFPEGRIIGASQELTHIETVSLLWIHASPAPGDRIDRQIQAVRKHLPEGRMVVLSNIPTQQESLLALHAGASGYCHVRSAPPLFQQVATVVSNGGLWIGSDLMSRILAATRQLGTPDPGHPVLDQLTPREREVAMAVARGISNKEVAHQLNITERTVKAHLSNIFEKLDVRDRLQLVVQLRQEGGPESDRQDLSKSSLAG